MPKSIETAQSIADRAKAAWDAWRVALNAGRTVEAARHEREFDRLCADFQRC